MKILDQFLGRSEAPAAQLPDLARNRHRLQAHVGRFDEALARGDASPARRADLQRWRDYYAALLAADQALQQGEQ